MAAAGHAGDPRRVPVDVRAETIQPFPTFSEIYVAALETRATTASCMGGPRRVVRE